MAAKHPGRRDPQRTLELLWGGAARSARGPKPSLSLARIVQTAVDIADTEGLAAVSMRRVAEELGVTTMSLYRYVPGKDDLVELMFDAGVGPPPDPGSRRGPWRAELEGWALDVQEGYRRRPWLLQIPIEGPPMGPNNLAWMDAALGPLLDTGLSEADSLYSLLLLTIYVRGEAQLGFGLAQAEVRTGVSPQEREQIFARAIEALVDNNRFPALARLANAGTFEEDEDDVDLGFEFGLNRILDGIEALIEKRRGRR